MSAGECVNGRGQTVTVASGTLLTRCTKSITVDGTFIVESNTYIETETIYVTAHGSVQIGTEASPVSNVTIYLNHTNCESMVTDTDREGGSYENYGLSSCLERGQIKVEGSWKSYGTPRTAWTLLIEDCVNTGESTVDSHDCPDVLDGNTLPHKNFNGCGCSNLKVDECDGWEAGDRVVVAYNLQRIPGGGTPRETKEHTIASITRHAGVGYENCTVHLTAPTDVPHIGDNAYKTFANTLGNTVKLQAEVMNLERSIHITGPMHWRQSDEATGGQGIVTRAEGSGEIVMKWHRMSNCGRVLKGHYCHHFHHRHQAGGEVTGAVIERSVSKGITVHGTSNTMLHSNVIWNHRGAGIYYEVSITTLTQSLTLLSTKHNFQLDNVGGFLWPNGFQLHEFVVGHGVVMLVLTVPPCALCKEVPLRPTLLQIVAVTEVVDGLGKLVANGPLVAIFVLFSGLETSNACLPFLSLAMLQVLIAMLFTSLDKDWCLSLH